MPIGYPHPGATFFNRQEPDDSQRVVVLDSSYRLAWITSSIALSYGLPEIAWGLSAPFYPTINGTNLPGKAAA